MPCLRWRQLLAVTSTFALVIGLVGCTGTGDLSVDITSPNTTVYSNGDVTVQVAVGGAPDSVELRVDGALLVALSAPYAYTWATANHEEGTYELTAVARSGGRSVTSTPRTVVIDRTRPTVTERTPVPNGTNVWHADPIRVRFSEPLRASVVLERVGGAPIASTLELRNDGTSLTILVTESIAVPADVRLSLSDAITDLAGNALVAPEPWTWNLPFWQWVGGERLVVEPELIPTSSVLALMPDGRPFVTWLEERLNTRPPSDVQAALWTGDAWLPLGGRLNGDDRLGPMYSLAYGAVDATGAPFVSWVSATSAREGWVHRWDGSAWQPVGGGAFTGASEATGTVAVAVDSDGHPVVAWIARVAGGADGTEVRVSRWTGSDWVQLGTPRRRDALRGTTYPHLVLGADGRPVVAWTERVDDSPQSPWTVHVDRWTGSDWEQLGGSLGSPPASAVLPRLAVVPTTGELLMGSMYGQSGDQRYAVRRWDPATQVWQAIGNLRSDSATDVYAGSLAVDPMGRPVATWTEARPLEGGGTGAFTVVRRREGTQWLPLGGPEVTRAYNAVNDVHRQLRGRLPDRARRRGRADAALRSRVPIERRSLRFTGAVSRLVRSPGRRLAECRDPLPMPWARTTSRREAQLERIQAPV
jgi:hypothetical protein